MSYEIELLTEIRDLMQVMAEPALAKRDEKLRSNLRRAIGKNPKKGQAAMLMDGTRSQAAIVKAAGIDQGDLSRLVKALSQQSLIASDEKHPKLKVMVPSNFFDNGENVDE